jgi:restriction system protein
MNMKANLGTIQVEYKSRGGRLFYVEVTHEGLKKHRLIKGPTREFVQNNAIMQALEWDEKWKNLKTCWDGKDKALYLTKESQRELEILDNLLRDGIKNEAFSLNQFKDNSTYDEPKPKSFSLPEKPKFKLIPDAPIQPEFVFRKINPIFNLVPWIKQRIVDKEQIRYKKYLEEGESAFKTWEKEKLEIERENDVKQKEYEQSVIALTDKYEELIIQWRKRGRDYQARQKELNEPLEVLRNGYLATNQESVVDFFTLVLNFSAYPEYFSKDFDLEYNIETKTLVIDYSFFSPSILPTLKEVKYIQSRREFSEKHLSNSDQIKLYDNVLYQITLRSLYEIFKADVADAVQAIVFNGWVSTINLSTGKSIKPCVLSIQVLRSEFIEINLENVDPKICFKALKGIGSSKLHSLVSIPPIMQSQTKNDPRFTESYDVAHELNDSFNLATMDWEDFEHLIRELFEKEFSSTGCEVKVTRASRDGGVDAVIFNPDPIHGGKTVIQAKRYTNPVGVSAVRDLYGTVMNEGANKGILVTTSDFGPDSYNFAKDKPLVLFNGGNLLHLLQKHGHKAKINLEELKRA